MKFEVSEDLAQFGITPYKPGKAPLYHPKMCEVVIATAQEGGFTAAMCIRLGISEATFRNYARDYPEFAEAIEFSKLILLAQQEELLQLGAKGKIKNYDFKANSYILNNKYRNLYDKSSGSNNTEITVNTINLTPEQMNDRIQQKIEKLRSMNVDLTYLSPSNVKSDPITIISEETENNFDNSDDS